ncbi:hypothetical protein KWAN_124 [Erwinia phage vB_EamM_Kwan]|uniref:Uncharacterized protein n=1 Tax=Erwinia phage vB_EamM_Kwan TaxID=1883374 RepID=A0A1B2IDW7_9CAUD|nr:hypothetical protein BIZ80_gp175 [Erwinia phage vB_EamM_Kwan]ANZ49476.1 hypothetical protein KWAN_124 [Erwinia phage vB_EamM_Kwan]
MGLLSKLFGEETTTTTVKNPLDNTIVVDKDLGFFAEEVARIGVALSHAHSRSDSRKMARCLAALRLLREMNEDSGFQLAMPKNLSKYRMRKARGDFPFLNV